MRIDTHWATANPGDIRIDGGFARLAPDVILAHGTSTVRPLLQATGLVTTVGTKIALLMRISGSISRIFKPWLFGAQGETVLVLDHDVWSASRSAKIWANYPTSGRVRYQSGAYSA